MKNVVLFAFTLMLYSCGGEAFTAVDFSSLDAADSGGSAVTSTGGAAGTGGAPQETGGSSNGAGGSFQETGGSFQATGGAPEAEADAGSGGAGGAGGALATGGATPTADACALVTHDNGLGATWEDCVPLNTYNQEQATKACRSSGAASCIVDTVCSGTYRRVYGVSGAQGIGSWLFSGTLAGYASPWNANICGGATDPRNQPWG